VRVLVIENTNPSKIGLLGVALEEAGAELDVLRAYETPDAVPANSSGYDALVVLGGPQNARADDLHPELPAIAALTRNFGDADKAVMGICLGSQLVARGHGAENVLDRPMEFGWHEVRQSAEGAADPVMAAIGRGEPIFHSHRDTFTLPPGAVHLASSDRTPNQAFRLGRAVYAVQFHFEASRDVVSFFSDAFAERIASHTPDWPQRQASEAETHGVRADEVGLDIARRWVSLIR